MDEAQVFATVKNDFPILQQLVHGAPLAYLDNAATTQKPNAVLQRLQHYYACENANIHRGVHYLSEQATLAFEEARRTVQRFLNARFMHECIFTKGTTEAINLVASAFGDAFVHAGDEIVVSGLEHHANLVPWQLLCQRRKAHLKIIPLLESGDLDLTVLAQLLTEKTRLVAVTQVSNALGTVNDIKHIIELAHLHNVPVLVDGAQSAPHMAIDVQALDCDFFTFSSHKIYGPTGVGVLYGKETWLERMPPYQGGGDMILQVNYESATYNSLPYKFEAGTPPIAAAVALAEALRYFQQFPIQSLQAHEHSLIEATLAVLAHFPRIRLIGTPKHRSGSVSFVLQGVHPHDLGTILDQTGVAIRTGHHCAMPVMAFYQIPASARVSFGLYNDHADVARLKLGLEHVHRVFKLT